MHTHEETPDHDHLHSQDGNEHSHMHHFHEHEHHHEHHDCAGPLPGSILTVRAASGLSGDMLLSGLASLTGLKASELEALVRELKLPALDGALKVEPRSVNHIAGVGCRITLPHEHAHRTLADIRKIIMESEMPMQAKELATRAFEILAEAEAAVHNMTTEEVNFHEVGALDSILDTCLVCRLYTIVNPDRFICSPLPLADGVILCAHGHVSSPAPAVLRLLQGVPVTAFTGKGETVTPTAISLLKALGAEFGPWPSMTVERAVISYGNKVFENAPNGAVWAFGRI